LDFYRQHKMSTHDLEKGAAVEAAHPPHQHQRALPAPVPSRIANPASLGLFSFASTTFILSMYNLQVRSITHPNVVIGMAIFCGGLAQFLAGMWEFPKGNAFGATAFTSYGAFWLSYATILIPGSGTVAAYTSKTELSSALGIFLICWCLVTSFFGIVSIGKSVSFLLLFWLLALTFALLAAGEINASANVTKAGGGVGVVVAFIAYYIGLADLLNAEANPPFRLPLGNFKPKTL